MTVDLHLGDCLDILPTLADGSVDAVITDPPYARQYQLYVLRNLLFMLGACLQDAWKSG